LRSAERADTEVERISFLTQAVALYQGELLPGFYEDWILPQQQRLASLCLQALRELTAHWREAGDLEQAIKYARQAGQVEPLAEECHRDLLSLYAETGQVSLALRQYRELEGLLKQEVGSAPSGATQELIRAIQAQELSDRADHLVRTRQQSVPDSTEEDE